VQGAKINEFLSLSKMLDLEDALGKRQSESLTNENDIEWLGSITIGSNNQQFMIDFDSAYFLFSWHGSHLSPYSTAGSTDFWVPSSACTDSTCATKHLYDAANSTTSKAQDGNFSIHYGDGSTASGILYTDTGMYSKHAFVI